MVTLSQESTFFRKTFVWIALGILLVLVIIFFGKSIKNLIFPPPPLPATVAFGKLPRPDKRQAKFPAGITFSLDTVSGRLPALAGRAKVFAIATPGTSFGDLDRARALLAKVEFTGEPTQVSGTVWRFTDLKNVKRTIDFDTANNNFTLSSDLSLSNIGRSQTADDAKRIAQNFLDSLNLDSDDFPPSKVSLTNLNFTGGTLVKAQSLGDTTLVKVSYSHSDLDKIPVLTMNFDQASVWVLVSEKGVVGAQVKTAKIIKNKFATYPLKGIAKAYEELKSGNAILNKDFSGENFSIKNVSLAYLEGTGQMYLTPYYAFYSENGLIAFVGAVDDSWFLNQSQ